MQLNDDQRLAILKLEMGLVQTTLDKYDDLIFRSRNWFITIWMGAIGLSFTIRSADLPLLAVFAAFLYWFIEGMMRHQYWYKYVTRYRALREWVNSDNSEAIAIYDLTNSLGRQPGRWKRFYKCFFKVEPATVYILMGLAAVVVRGVLTNGVAG
jgi:hypothetical protein